LFQQFFNGTANHRTDDTVEVLKKARIFFEVLDAIKVIQKKKLELVLIHHYMVHLEQLWMKQSQRLNTSLKN
jgi:2,4-dienoyl-CoA reductase-like NADH-dependent reductase (Old Yellow Enzyme family)